MPQLHRHSHSQPQLYRQTYNLNRPGTGDHGDIATIDLTIAMMANIPEKIRPFSIQALPRDYDLLGGLSLLTGATCMVFQHVSTGDFRFRFGPYGGQGWALPGTLPRTILKYKV